MWNHCRCSLDCASWALKQPYDRCLRDIKLWLKANRRWLQGKRCSHSAWRGSSAIEEASTGRSFGEEYWNPAPLVQQSSMRQGYCRWLPVGCTSLRAVTYIHKYIYIYIYIYNITYSYQNRCFMYLHVAFHVLQLLDPPKNREIPSLNRCPATFSTSNFISASTSPRARPRILLWLSIDFLVKGRSNGDFPAIGFGGVESHKHAKKRRRIPSDLGSKFFPKMGSQHRTGLRFDRWNPW